MLRFRSAPLVLLFGTLALSGPLQAGRATAPPPANAEEAQALASGEDEPKLPADRLETRRGTLAIEADPDDEFAFWATLDGERLVKLEGDRATIVAHLGQGARDVALLETGSGGIACPYQYRFLDLRPHRVPVLSEEFGSCAAWEDAAFEGTRVVIRMPAYVPHPDLLTAAEVTRLEHTTLFYTWDKGAVRERSAIHK